MAVATTTAKKLPPEAKTASKGPEAANKTTKPKQKTVVGDIGREAGQMISKAATQRGSEMTKKAASTVIQSFIFPIRAMMANPLIGMAAQPIAKILGSRLDKYIQQNNIDFPMNPSEVIQELLFGDPSKLSDEITNTLEDFISKSLPKNITDAVQTGNPLKIASAFGTNISSGAQGLVDDVKQTQGGNNFFMKTLNWVGNKVPGLNRLPNKARPWAAGAGILMFGGMIFRAVKSMIKWVAALAAGGAGMAFLSKMMSGGGKTAAKGGLGALMSGASGAGGLMQKGMGLMQMLGPVMSGGARAAARV